MGNRGFVLLELLVAAAIGVLVLLGIGSFYVATARFNVESTAQTFIQRQGTIIVDELTTVIPSATDLRRTTCSGVAGSLQVTNENLINVPGHPATTGPPSTPIGKYCFRLNATGGDRIVVDRPDGGSIDLLTGSPVTLTVPAGGFTVCVSGPPSDTCFLDDTKGTLARVTFKLDDTLQDKISMTFATSLARRN